jgi:hypothetical protein
MASPLSPAPPSPPTIPPMPPSLPSPPGAPPSPPPIELLIADVVSWFWLSVLFAMIVISVLLRAASGRSLSAKPGAVRGALRRYAEQCTSSFPRSRGSAAGLLRAVAVGLLRALAALFLVSASLVFYGEARFSVMSSYGAPACAPSGPCGPTSDIPQPTTVAAWGARLRAWAAPHLPAGGVPQPLRPHWHLRVCASKIAAVTAFD